MIKKQNCTRPQQEPFCGALRSSWKPTFHSVHESTDKLYLLLWAEQHKLSRKNIVSLELSVQIVGMPSAGADFPSLELFYINLMLKKSKVKRGWIQCWHFPLHTLSLVSSPHHQIFGVGGFGQKFLSNFEENCDFTGSKGSGRNTCSVLPL